MELLTGGQCMGTSKRCLAKPYKYMWAKWLKYQLTVTRLRKAKGYNQPQMVFDSYAIINVLVYGVMNKQYQDEVKKLLVACCPCKSATVSTSAEITVIPARNLVASSTCAAVTKCWHIDTALLGKAKNLSRVNASAKPFQRIQDYMYMLVSTSSNIFW